MEGEWLYMDAEKGPIPATAKHIYDYMQDSLILPRAVGKMSGLSGVQLAREMAEQQRLSLQDLRNSIQDLEKVQEWSNKMMSGMLNSSPFPAMMNPNHLHNPTDDYEFRAEFIARLPKGAWYRSHSKEPRWVPRPWKPTTYTAYVYIENMEQVVKVQAKGFRWPHDQLLAKVAVFT